MAKKTAPRKLSTSSARFTSNTFSDLQNVNQSPIFGYEDLPVVTLEKAVQKLLSLVPNLTHHVIKAKEKCNKDSEVLTLNESAAIYLYSMPVPFFSRLNSALRAEKRHALKPWFSFLKLFLTALDKLPSLDIRVWRGVGDNVNADFTEGQMETWWSVNSCSKDLNIVEKFLGDKGTLFSIDVLHGKDISEYSSIPEEREVVLIPGTRLLAKCKPCNFADRLLIIHLVEEKDHLLEETIHLIDRTLANDTASQDEEISLMSEEECNIYMGISASISTAEYEGPRIVENERPPRAIYECDGDSVIRLLNPANLEIEAEQKHFAHRDTGAFMNWFFIRKLVFHNSSKETIAVLHLSGEYEDTLGNWQMCKYVMIGQPVGPNESITFSHDVCINLPASNIASYAVNMAVEAHCRPGYDENYQNRAHKSFPQPLKLRLTAHDTMGKVCRLIFEQFNSPLVLPTPERTARKLSIDAQQIVDWISVDDSETLTRIFTVLYLDDKACLHVVTVSSNNTWDDRYLDEDNIKSLQKKAKKQQTAEMALENFGVSDKIQHIALFDPATFRMYALRIILLSTTSKTSKMVRLPLDKIRSNGSHSAM
ncbi:unnamed protein product [Adineta ricciae]|uniref:NAD(P)(+)--arginine ADP-ribosyltransferase n=1 Tax=Adineta ricciae TaxID=249248 RepID=A0A814FFU3_ADIRI|nr:unnamed protein product [Adineta ricciae]CAF1363758.1 unnamed protein product [Adineta ricciae]